MVGDCYGIFFFLDFENNSNSFSSYGDMFFFVQTLGTGFATLNNMHLTMLRRYWWGTRLTWMKAKG